MVLSVLAGLDVSDPGFAEKNIHDVALWGIKRRTRQGLAASIRHRLVAGVILSLIIAGISVIIAGSGWIHRYYDAADVYIFVATLCVIGVIAGGLYALRSLSQSLVSIEQIEKALSGVCENGESHQRLDHLDDSLASNPLVAAYNALVNRLEENDAQELKFLEMVCHELRSPLASIIGYAELLSYPTLRHDEQYLDKCYQAITEQGQKMSRFIEDVVTAKTLDTDRQRMEMGSLRLAPLVEEVLRDARRETCREIFFENQAGDVRVAGDALCLRSALLKLVDNGVKYSAPDQPIQVKLLPGKEPGWIEIPVCHRGVGIDEAIQPLLFRRFDRINNGRTRLTPGAGLGLYIVHNVIQHHKGKITLQSQPGEGSTFTVHLPLAEEGR